jgi:hypothetical protein
MLAPRPARPTPPEPAPRVVALSILALEIEALLRRPQTLLFPDHEPLDPFPEPPFSPASSHPSLQP